MPTAQEFRAGFRAALRAATDTAAPWPTTPPPPAERGCGADQWVRDFAMTDPPRVTRADAAAPSFAELRELWAERMADRERATAMYATYAAPGAVLNGPAGYNYAAAVADAAAFTGSYSREAPPSPTVESIRETMRKCPAPGPEQVIVTPSLDAIRAVVPFAVELTPDGRQTMSGVRVVVTKYAKHPQLIPAEAFDRHYRNLPGVMA